MACEVALPEIGKSLGFDGQVVYFKNVEGDVRHGLGLRFFDISSEDEATLIEYLNWLESGI